MKKLPLGIQTFSEIRNDDYLYVDKTGLAQQLINSLKFVFLSRPRRFGKSLFLSTLHDLFEGRKELFTGLAAEQTHDWTQTHPVIRLDMSGNQSTLEENHSLIYSKLLDNQEALGLSGCENDNLSAFFAGLIKRAHQKYGKKVVILVDEYEKPLLDNITNKALSSALRDRLQGFYAVIKENDKYLRFVFLTGVTKFSRVSIFSGLNNLQDISLKPEYATICGYTQCDLETTFAEHLHGVDWHKLRDWYNGYQFNGGPVYNPYDILQFIDSDRKYSNHWFKTGTPTFLIKQLQQKQYYLPNVESIVLSEADMDTADIDNLRIETLLLQTGYLTIDKIEESPMGLFFHVCIPNKEVRISLSEHLLQAITKPAQPTSYNRNALYQALHNADMDNVKETLTAIFASIPYHIYSNSPLSHYEGYYSVVMYSYLLSLGVTIQLERSTNKGRLDMVVDIADKRYLMEFKMDGKGDALQQIKDKQYFQAFYDTEREIYLVGIDFSEEERNLSGFAWEKYLGESDKIITSGFVAGTLVHTDNGLVPIQNIKVGDRVLSRPERGGQDAPTEYKRVTKAVCLGEGELVRFTYCKDDDFEVDDADTHVIFMTGGYPIWVEEANNWRPITNLESGVGISNFKGQKDLTVLSIETVFGIEKNNKLYAACAHPSYGNDDSDEIDMFIDFNKINYVVDLFNSDFKYVGVAYDDLRTEFKDIAFEAFCNSRIVSVPIYNLEVEDYHSYFVGDKGIWVHDNSPINKCEEKVTP